MATFRDRLEIALAESGLTAADLARVTGINEGAISQYRKGAYKASQPTLEKLAKALSVSIPWLMGLDVPMKRDEYDDPQGAGKLSLDFLSKLDHLMEQRGLNKSTLSKACDIPYTTIDGLYKKGYEGLKLPTLKKLADFFGTSLDYWAIEDGIENQDLTKISIAYASLNDEGRQRLVQYADDLAGMEKYKRTSEKPKKEPTIVLTAASDGSVGGSYVTDAEADIEKARQLGAQAAQREKDRRNYSKIHGKKPKR